MKIGGGECVDLWLELLASCDDGFEKLDRRKSARLERGNCLRCRHVTEIEIEIAHRFRPLVHLYACPVVKRVALQARMLSCQGVAAIATLLVVSNFPTTDSISSPNSSTISAQNASRTDQRNVASGS